MTTKNEPDGVLSLRGRRVVVVGGTSGMGLGAAQAAARAGAEVIVAGRRPVDNRSEHSLRHVVMDVTNEASVRATFEALDALDHLFITATPPAVSKPFLEQDLATAQSFMNGKFFGTWACARHAAPRMRPSGSITFLTGCASIRPRPNLSIVTATFAALESLAQCLALDLAPIRVNAIRPGVVDSAMWDFLDDEARARFRRKVADTMPARRIGRIEDIGHAAVFLMTNPYVTGTVLEVSGGEPLVTLEI
jgi:NAD(P)-dependent dehydrogenase (short-subunit alcohol dehydrogenase family)